MANVKIPMKKQMAMGLQKGNIAPGNAASTGMAKTMKGPAVQMKPIGGTRSAPGMKSAAPTGKGVKIK
jgi:hypothetical protein